MGLERLSSYLDSARKTYHSTVERCRSPRVDLDKLIRDPMSYPGKPIRTSGYPVFVSSNELNKPISFTFGRFSLSFIEVIHQLHVRPDIDSPFISVSQIMQPIFTPTINVKEGEGISAERFEIKGEVVKADDKYFIKFYG